LELSRHHSEDCAPSDFIIRITSEQLRELTVRRVKARATCRITDFDDGRPKEVGFSGDVVQHSML